jgi:crossover junction endodeoxyribonuclease RuvC
MALAKEKIILGIDPGTLHLGYGIVTSKGQDVKMVCMGTIHLVKYENHQIKLQKIFEKITFLIEEYMPDEMAVECPFYGENAQSMLKLGRAQGVSMVAGLIKGIPVAEYYPKKVKLAVTGSGNASKEQVAAMLQKTLKIESLPKSLDATDALAVAVCHHYATMNTITSMNKFSGWKDFIKQNEKKIVIKK